MSNNTQPDPIDRALRALTSTAPPAGIEDRVLQRLAEQRITAPMSRSAWLRGAITGALAATTACAALFFTLRAHQTTLQTATVAGVPHSSRSLTRDEWEETPPPATSVALRSSAPCPGAPFMRDRQSANEWEEKSSSHPAHLIPASFAPSHPAPPAPLTAQERALVQLTRNASPALLASLSPAAQQKADAKRQADFDAFFAPSAAILKVDEEQKKALGISNDDDTPAPNSIKEGSL